MFYYVYSKALLSLFKLYLLIICILIELTCVLVLKKYEPCPSINDHSDNTVYIN